MSARSAVVGQTLPPLEIPVTRTFIVAAAIASRDYQDVHHDPDLARMRGSRDIFLNILTSNGLAERYARCWAGPEAIVTRLAVRLGVPCYPGDTLRFSGVVAEVEESALRLDVTAENAVGAHLTARVGLRLPDAGS